MVYDLSIAISSYNRDDKVAQTLRTLFESELLDVKGIEVIIIDDGSPKPVEAAIKSVKPVPEKFHVRVMRQENSGIGATRNRGYQEAQSDRILLLDDDIVLPHDTIEKLLAAQKKTGAAVIFGHYPFITHSSGAVKKFAAELYGYDHIVKEEEFEKLDALTSGLLLLDRSQLPDREKFYRDDMTIPAAEEHEVIARFHKTGIPIYAANHISAIHNHHLELKWLVTQQYKYGLATAEAFVKVPAILEMEKFAEIRRSLDFTSNSRGTNLVKRLCASRVGRWLLLMAGRGLEKASPRGNHNKLYGIVAAAHFWGGYHDGLKRFDS
jgi:glycosyltransferase involved in cell wall biosynthesis